jgi:hypothetical protein
MFLQIIQGDVDFGYSFVIPRDKVVEIEDTVVSPMNIADQSGNNKKGEIIFLKKDQRSVIPQQHHTFLKWTRSVRN